MLDTGVCSVCVLEAGLCRGYVLDTSSSSPYFGLFKSFVLPLYTIMRFHTVF